jgi:hypothetical protein
METKPWRQHRIVTASVTSTYDDDVSLVVSPKKVGAGTLQETVFVRKLHSPRSHQKEVGG